MVSARSANCREIGLKLGFAEARLQLGSEIPDGVELRVLVDPYVVELGQDALLHFVDGDFEGDVLAGAITEPFRELGVEREDRLGLGTLEPFIDAVDEKAGAHLIEQIGGGRPFHRFPVLGRLDVDRDEVTERGRAVGFLDRRELFEHAFDLHLELLGRHLR